MKKMNFLLLSLLILTASTACNKDKDEKDPADDFTKHETTYTGTATTVVEYWDYDLYAGDYFVGKKTYNYPGGIYKYLQEVYMSY